MYVVAGIPLKFSSHYDSGPYTWTRVSCFLKVHTWPSSTMTIWDLDAGVDGFLRLNMQSDGRLVAEASYKGGYGAPDLSTGLTMYLDAWYWCSVLFGNTGDNTSFAFFGQTWGPGGSTSGVQGNPRYSAGAGHQTLSCLLGWGESLSSFYQNFPNSIGNEMDALVIETASGDGSILPGTSIGLYPAPNTDIDPAALSPADAARPGVLCATTKPTALYLCHESVGSTSVIHDATSNHYDLGPGDFTIAGDGPY